MFLERVVSPCTTMKQYCLLQVAAYRKGTKEEAFDIAAFLQDLHDEELTALITVGTRGA
jgi:hypothetical protein